MTSFQERLRRGLSQLMFKELVVDSARDVSPSFRRLRVTGPWLRTTTVSPGDKLQIMIDESGPRTYTPFAHDTTTGTFDLLAYVHAETPASSWIREARPGTKFRAFGPRGSLALATLPGPIVLFGDETSFGVARSLQLARGTSDGLSFVFECSHAIESTAVLADLSLKSHVVVERQPERAHLEQVFRHLGAALERHSGAHLVLTGHAQMIQALRARLKTQPFALAGQKVKAYWADGKRGLD
jgi:NADPH-dependent ferric siderophore reductase